MEMRKEKGSGSMSVLTPDPRSGSNKNHRNSIPQKHGKHYRITLTRDFWRFLLVMSMIFGLPVIYMLLQLAMGVA